MGVPRLATYLSPFAVQTILSCERKDCEHHAVDPERSTHVIIDGPSFAYVLYDRLVTNKPADLDALGAIPSYNEIGKATLRFLGELEKCGSIIDKIYFDGFLPKQKQETRISRSEGLLRKLLSSYTSQPKGFQNVSQANLNQRIKTKKLYKRSFFQSNFRGLPPAPFLVPAVIEALADSKYTSITAVVPGEADGCCAQAARQNGGTILTNDSDLLVYDLGPDGAVGSLHALTIVGDEEKKSIGNNKEHRRVLTTIIKPLQVAQNLGLENLRTLAYALKTSPQLSFHEAVQYAKTTKLDQDQADNHLAEYETPPPIFASIHCHPFALQYLQLNPHLLDPRLSEFILQAHTSRSCKYLPILIEDPTRTSASVPSASLRRLVYSIAILSLQGNQYRPTQILETIRKGQKITPVVLTPLTKTRTVCHASKLADSLKYIKPTFSSLSLNLSPASIYRIHALYDLYTWHLDTAHSPPPRDAMASVLTGKIQGGISWDMIHLFAQIEAELYSLRMLKQTLGFCLPLFGILDAEHEHSLVQMLRTLRGELEDLPGLAELLPNRAELMDKNKVLDIDVILDQLALLLWRDVGKDEADEDGDGRFGDEGVGWDELKKEVHGDAGDKNLYGGDDAIVGKKKKKKKKKTKQKKREISCLEPNQPTL